MRALYIICGIGWLTAVLQGAVPGGHPPAGTLGERQISRAGESIANGAPSGEVYNALALAFIQRAREVPDPDLYEKARVALSESFRLSPENFEGQKTRVWLLLGQRDFAGALRAAAALNKRVPDEVVVYGMLVDAHMALGNYPAAETAAQWMLDLRPGNVEGLVRAAGLRELFGDLEGALDLYNRAYERTPAANIESRAGLLTQLAHVHFLNGRLKSADEVLAQALRLCPGYYYALQELARVRSGQKRHHESVELLQRCVEQVRGPENLFALAEALQRDGGPAAAANAFAEFRQQALAATDRDRNANRELIYYYIEHAGGAKAALELAEKEMARAPNAFIRGAYALALQANGRETEARQEFEKILAMGLREPVVLEHARRAGVKPPAAE